MAQSRVGGLHLRCCGFRLENGKFENDRLLFAGKVHQGLNPANRRALLRVLQPLQIEKCPFANLPTSKSGHEGVIAEMGDYVWLRPEMVAEIRFAEWTVFYATPSLPGCVMTMGRKSPDSWPYSLKLSFQRV